MKWISLIALAMFVAACGGGDDSMASKSAAAYREAQAKGVPVGGGHEHHQGHETATGTSGTAVEHHAHGTDAPVDHAAMRHDQATSDHAQHGTTSPAGGGHEGHRSSPSAAAHDHHAGMRHGATTAAADLHAGHRQPTAPAQMDHTQHGTPGPAATDPHAGHRMTGATPAPVAVSAPRSNAEMRSVQPPSTLQPDAFDAPAASSVSEAAKASGGGGHEGHGQHGAAAAAVYSCPMHPEVTSDKPGTCPKCGMALVKKN